MHYPCAGHQISVKAREFCLTSCSDASDCAIVLIILILSKQRPHGHMHLPLNADGVAWRTVKSAVYRLKTLHNSAGLQCSYEHSHADLYQTCAPSTPVLGQATMGLLAHGHFDHWSSRISKIDERHVAVRLGSRRPLHAGNAVVLSMLTHVNALKTGHESTISKPCSVLTLSTFIVGP